MLTRFSVSLDVWGRLIKVGTLVLVPFVNQGRIQDFCGGRGPVLGGMGLKCGRFSVKMFVKTKELGPMGGVCRKILFVDPPMPMLCKCCHLIS